MWNILKHFKTILNLVFTLSVPGLTACSLNITVRLFYNLFFPTQRFKITLFCSCCRASITAFCPSCPFCIKCIIFLQLASGFLRQLLFPHNMLPLTIFGSHFISSAFPFITSLSVISISTTSAFITRPCFFQYCFPASFVVDTSSSSNLSTLFTTSWPFCPLGVKNIVWWSFAIVDRGWNIILEHTWFDNLCTAIQIVNCWPWNVDLKEKLYLQSIVEN